MIVREATDIEVIQLYKKFMKISTQIDKLRIITKAYDNKLEWFYSDNKNLLDLITYIIYDIDRPQNITINMLEITDKTLDLIAMAECLLEDLEEIVKDLKKSLRIWKKEIGIGGSPGNDYLEARNIVDKLLKKLM